VSGFTLTPLDGYQPPGVESFDLPPLIPGVEWANKFLLQAVLSVAIILVFWIVMARKRAMVPSRGQFVGEYAYMFVRNSIGRDVIGHDFKKWVPLLIALFSFVLVNNLWGVFPLFLMPTAAHVGWAYGLAGLVWLIYNGIGIKKFGPLGYLKHATMPPGVPGPMLIIVAPLEFLSNIIVRPATLSLRLFANMFAGHLLVLVFVLGGEYLLLHSLLIFGLEIFVQSLQAYIFTMLTAQYISSASAEEH
jgi:F-type H+-transporting ATPase subunit a